MADTTNTPADLKKRETLEIIPQYYSFVLEDPYSTRKAFFNPTKFAVGDILRKTPAQLHSQLQTFLKSVKNSSYELSILEESDLEEVTNTSLQQAIQKKNGAYNLWRVGKESILDLGNYGGKTSCSVISSNVKSVSNGHVRPTYHEIHFPPNCFELGSLKYIYSTSKDFANSLLEEIGGVNDIASANSRGTPILGSVVVDIYLAAALTDYLEKHDSLDKLPFLFPSNPELEMEVIIAHYLKNKSSFKIDKKLLDMQDVNTYEFVNPLFRDALQTDRAYVGVFQKGHKKRQISDELNQENLRLKMHMDEQFRVSGYQKRGLALEFKGTKYETVAEMWHKENMYTTLLFSNLFPPLIVTRDLSMPLNGLGVLGKDMQNPLAYAEEEYLKRYTKHNMPFDMLRTNAATKIIIPDYAMESKELLPKYVRN